MVQDPRKRARAGHEPGADVNAKATKALQSTAQKQLDVLKTAEDFVPK